MSTQLSFHHVTAVSSNAKRTIAFYTTGLGLRLLRETVNYDDLSVLEIHCGDVRGTPGTVIAFLISPTAAPGLPGTGQISNLVFSVQPGTLGYWFERLESLDATIVGWADSFGEKYLCFNDPDGLPLALVEDTGDLDQVSDQSLPTLGRLRSAELQLHGFEHTARFLKDVLGFVQETRDGAVLRFRLETAATSNVLDLVSAPDLRRGVDGAGITHRLAWRVGSLAELNALRQQVVDYGLDATPVLDRHYYKAVYFDAPGGVRFGLVTDTLGFGVPDRQTDGRITLPPWLERQRSKIEKRIRRQPDGS